MRRFKRHPRFERLSAFSDGSLEGDSQREVAEHLESCGRCRAEVAAIRETDAALREAPMPRLPEDMFARVLERRASGVRTLLPDGPIARPVRRRSRSAAAVAGLVAVAALAALLTTGGEASAGASSLTVDHPGAGAGFAGVTYAPGVHFRNEGMVRARARIWPLDGGPAYTADLGALGRDGETFRGTVLIPDGAGYVLFAIEDESAAVVDPRWGEFWQPWGPDEAPPIDAAMAEIRALQDLGEQGLLRSSETARTLRHYTEVYPNEVRLWEARATFEDVVGSEDASPRHHERLEGFAEAALFGELAVSDVAATYRYALLLGRTDLADRLRDRLASIDARHVDLLSSEAAKAFGAHLRGEIPARDLFEHLEETWRAAPHETFAARAGFSLATRTGDPGTIVRWANRYADLGFIAADEVALELARTNSLRVAGIERLRERIDLYASPPDALRPVHVSRGNFENSMRRRRAELLAALGAALRDEGRQLAALEAYRASIDDHWDPAVAEKLLEAAGRDGSISDDDRARWTRMILVDPLHESDLGTELDGADRSRAVRDLIVEIERRSGVRPRRAPDLDFRSRVSTRVPFETEGVTLIALLQVPPVPGSDDDVALAARASRLTEAGVRTLIAVPDEWLVDVVETANESGARAVVDEGGVVAQALGGWYVREYVVVHDGWYSVHQDLDEATRLALLRLETQ